jgi:hypothetical protein
MPFSYKCWKCPPLRSSQRCTRQIMLANTFCNVPVDILSTVRWMLAWSSYSVCVDDLNKQYPWDAHIKRSLVGLSPEIVEATISLKWGVQKTQIPSKPWVAWLFEPPVVSYVCGTILTLSYGAEYVLFISNILFIYCSLFNDAFSATQDYIALNEMISEWFGKDLEGNLKNEIVKFSWFLHFHNM